MGIGFSPFANPEAVMLQMRFFFLALASVAITGVAEPDPAVDPDASWRDRFMITERPVFPPGLAARGVTRGSASFLILVNREAELEDFVMLEASHLDVGGSIARVLPEWEFMPTVIDGAPVNAMSRISINIRSSGSVAMLSVGDDVQNLFPGGVKTVGEGQSVYRVAAMEDLDYLPELIHAVPPPPPPADAIRGDRVDVVFGMFIDEEGKVRMPMLQKAGEGKVDLQVLESVQQALKQWRFMPPTIEGRPVTVRVQQPFQLNSSPPMADDAVSDPE